MSESSVYVFDGAAAPEGAAVAPAGSILDRLRAVSLATVEAQTTTLPVPMRPGFEVEYAVYLPKPRLDALQMAHGTAEGDFSSALILAQCRGILVDGETWLGDDQLPVTFKSEALWGLLEVSDAFDAIKALYLRDPDVLRTGEAILRACGWDLNASLDPTRP